MKRRILFVDDEPLVLEGIEDLLFRCRRKWDMKFALSGRAALERMDESPFDVVVTDMRMPEMDGAALLREVRDRHPETVRIVLSGYAETRATMRAVKVAHQFLHKPCAAGHLEAVIERACGLQELMGKASMRSLLGRIESVPALPATFAALQRALADEQAAPEDVARIIERDIGVSARVLQIANSAFFGVGRPVSSIGEAVSLLGVGTLRQLVLAAELFDGADPTSEDTPSLETLRDHALLTAAIARRIVSGYKQMVEDATTAALLHDVGKMVLAAELPGHMESAQARACETGQTPHSVEQEMYGVTHAEVGAYLLGAWGLPYPIVEAVANHHSPSRVTAEPALDALTAVHVANVLAHEQKPNPTDSVSGGLDLEYLESLGLSGHIGTWREFAQELVGT